jgi:hypothetical protein
LKSRNVTIAVTEAEALVEAFQSLQHVSLDLIEIGNEPDDYPWTSSEDVYIDEYVAHIFVENLQRIKVIDNSDG